MPYIPHTDEDRARMLEEIGVASIDELFREIPEELRLRRELDVPPALDEHKLFGYLKSLADQNESAVTLDWFLGAGLYDRFIPATVGAVISRGEFLTAYTPYQPELSQGYLQTIYEFQTMVAELYGMDLANASMYDGSTSMAEAALLCCSATGRPKVAVSSAVHPYYRQVLATYAHAASIEVVELGASGGATEAAMPSDVGCLIAQSPNFFGVIEDVGTIAQTTHAAGAKLVVVADPIACALLDPPGALGADIVVGEGQPLGVAMGFGGPLVGLFAARDEDVRRLPGRIVGRTKDAQGRSGYVMTLRTREQDIRRERATSNICTNEALMALAATVYLCAMGKNGLRSVAESTVRNTQYAMGVLQASGARVRFRGRVFGEFVLDLPRSAEAVRDELIDEGIMAGLPLGRYYPEMRDSLLVAVTETRTRAEIDRFALCLATALARTT